MPSCKLAILKDLSVYRERVLTISRGQIKRALVHLEICCWIGPDLPAAPAPLLQAVDHMLHLQEQQRSPAKALLIHCRDGGSKSGTLCALTAAVAHIQVGL